MNHAEYNGRIISGETLDKQIMADYKEIQQGSSENEWRAMPKWEQSWKEMIDATKNVKQGNWRLGWNKCSTI